MNQVDIGDLPRTRAGLCRERSSICHWPIYRRSIYRWPIYCWPMTGGGFRRCAVGFIASVVLLLAYCPGSHAADDAYERHVGV
ncbi:MAG: hypothetical protein ACF8CQ_18060, partial [Rhodopirellula sp. JB044]